MKERKIVKIIAIIISVLFVKVAAFGFWHFNGIREMTANVLLPIAIHMLGGLGTVFLAWWLVDEGIRTQAKREEWEKVFAKALSDLRRNVWLAEELANTKPTAESSKVYGRYWMEGLHELRLRVPKHHSLIEHNLWALINQLDVCNKMLEEQALEAASEQANILLNRIKSLGPHIQELWQSLENLQLEALDLSELFNIEGEEKGFVKYVCDQSPMLQQI